MNKYENHFLASALVEFYLVIWITFKLQNISRARNIFEKVCDIILAATSIGGLDIKYCKR